MNQIDMDFLNEVVPGFIVYSFEKKINPLPVLRRLICGAWQYNKKDKVVIAVISHVVYRFNVV